MKTKKTLLSVVACVLALIMTFACAACTDKNGDPTVEKVELNQTSLELGVGDGASLRAVVTYSDGKTGANTAIDEWTSSNESVATVSKNGAVSAKAKGTATITAKAGEKSATCTINVVTITVELDQTSISIDKDKDKAGVQLNATVKKEGTAMSGQTIEWSSSDEKVVKVSNTGLVTPIGEGEATITAARQGGSQSATCAVEVTWEKPVGYNPVQWAEQNKMETNTWGYWNAKESSWAGGSLATDNGVYTDETFIESASTLKEGYEYIGMGRATFEFEITNPGAVHVYQIFYRSSDNVKGGLLHYNHVYELTFKIVSNKGGTIHVNPYDDIRPQGENESKEDYDKYLKTPTAKYNPNHDFDLEDGVEQTITVIFRHDDCGYIYKEGIYDNMGSALHIQLGDLIPNEAITLSVWDFQYKDLGEADNPVACDETKHNDYVDPDATNPDDVPPHPTAPEVKPVSASTATKAYLTVEEGKAIFNIEGTLDLSQFNDSAEEAKTWLIATHFDVQQCGGSWTEYAFNRVDATVDAEGAFHIKYDITYLGVDRAGTGAYTCHFTEKEEGENGYSDNKYRDLKLDAESAIHGSSVTVGNRKYSIVNYKDYESTADNGWGQAFNWGCVAIKVERVEA